MNRRLVSWLLSATLLTTLAVPVDLLGAELRTARIRSIAAVGTYVEHGALLGVVPRYRELGRAAAIVRALGMAIPDTPRRRAVVVE